MKRSQNIEVLRLTAEVHSLQSQLAFLRERSEHSVPCEIYEASVAENVSLKAENEILKAEIESMRLSHKGDLKDKERACAEQIAEMAAAHKAAEHTAFMYSLVESCRMNGLDFGLYIETVLRRIQDGDTDIHGMLPNVITLPNDALNASVA